MDLTLIKRTRIYDGRVFNTIVDDVEYPSGKKSVREVAQHPGGGVALPVFPDRSILMIRQHRYPLDQFIWELPAGKLEKGEAPLHCAQRELEEETGYTAASWRKITTIYTSPGFCSEQLHLYLASGLTQLPEGRTLEEGELTMTLHTLSLAEVKSKIFSGEIRDAKTICAVLMGEAFLATEVPLL